MFLRTVLLIILLHWYLAKMASIPYMTSLWRQLPKNISLKDGKWDMRLGLWTAKVNRVSCSCTCFWFTVENLTLSPVAFFLSVNFCTFLANSVHAIGLQFSFRKQDYRYPLKFIFLLKLPQEHHKQISVLSGACFYSLTRSLLVRAHRSLISSNELEY